MGLKTSGTSSMTGCKRRQPADKRAFVRAIKEEWANLPTSLLENLVDSHAAWQPSKCPKGKYPVLIRKAAVMRCYYANTAIGTPISEQFRNLFVPRTFVTWCQPASCFYLPTVVLMQESRLEAPWRRPRSTMTLICGNSHAHHAVHSCAHPPSPFSLLYAIPSTAQRYMDRLIQRRLQCPAAAAPPATTAASAASTATTTTTTASTPEAAPASATASGPVSPGPVPAAPGRWSKTVALRAQLAQQAGRAQPVQGMVGVGGRGAQTLHQAATSTKPTAAEAQIVRSVGERCMAASPPPSSADLRYFFRNFRGVQLRARFVSLHTIRNVSSTNFRQRSSPGECALPPHRVRWLLACLSTSLAGKHAALTRFAVVPPYLLCLRDAFALCLRTAAEHPGCDPAQLLGRAQAAFEGSVIGDMRRARDIMEPLLRRVGRTSPWVRAGIALLSCSVESGPVASGRKCVHSRVSS